MKKYVFAVHTRTHRVDTLTSLPSMYVPDPRLLILDPAPRRPSVSTTLPPQRPRLDASPSRSF